MIDITIDLSELEETLDDIQEALSDLKPLWTHLYQGLPPWFQTTFETDGFGNWLPTQRENPILRDTYRYHDSFVKGTTDTINQMTKTQWDYGSGVEYGHFHEEGTEREQRQVPGELAQHPQFQKWVEDEANRYFESIVG